MLMKRQRQIWNVILHPAAEEHTWLTVMTPASYVTVWINRRTHYNPRDDMHDASEIFWAVPVLSLICKKIEKIKKIENRS